MPTYEYACNACGQHLEVVQSFTDDSLTECPNCGGSLRKVFGNIGIVLKGSGFYKTDSRPSGGAKKSSRDNGADGTGTSTGDKTASAGTESGSGSSGSGDTATTAGGKASGDAAGSGKGSSGEKSSSPKAASTS